MRSKERELNALENAVILSDDDMALQELLVNTDDGKQWDDVAGRGKKPVRLEMKYNKSFRNAMLLRQTYSAIAGIAASALVQALVPIAFNFMVPQSVPVIVPVPKPQLHMVWVDRIFNAQIAFLVARAIALFLMP